MSPGSSKEPARSRRSLAAEIGLTVGAACALCLVTYVPHVIEGGWVLDDWNWVARLHFAAEDGLRGLVSSGLEANPNRPLFGLWLAGLYLAGDTGQSPYLLVGALIAAAQVALLYCVVRLMGMGTAFAATAAALLAVLPTIDTTRLWLSAYPATIATCLLLAGLATALLAFRQEGARGRVALHGVSLTLFALAVMTYELVVPLLLVTLPLYLLATRSPRRALPRALGDLAVAAIGLALIAGPAREVKSGDASLGHLVDRVPEVLSAWLTVIEAAVPFEGFVLGVPGLLLVLAASAGVARTVRSGDAAVLRDLIAYAAAAAIGLLWGLAGLLMLLPGDSYYTPRVSWLENRFSLASSLGQVVLFAAAAAALATGIAGLIGRRVVRMPLLLVLTSLAVISLLRTEWRQQDTWAVSWQHAQDVVGRVESTFPDGLPPRSSVVTFRHITVLPGNVTVFSTNYDLSGAVRLAFDDPSLTAHPWLAGVACGGSGVTTPATVVLPYQRLWFVDVSSRRAYPVSGRQACERLMSNLAA